MSEMACEFLRHLTKIYSDFFIALLNTYNFPLFVISFTKE